MRVLKIPSSKSHTIRALYLSLFSTQNVLIRNYLDCDDTDAMLEAMRLFGVFIKKSAHELNVVGLKGFKRPCKPIDARNSGLVFRFMTVFSSLFPYEIIVTGDDSIRKRRVIKPLVSALRQGGAEVNFVDPPNHAPLKIKGPINPTTFSLDGQDSQPVSALLMTLGFLKKKSTISVVNPQECSWIDVTLDWLKKMGVCVHCKQYKKYTVFPSPNLQGFDVTLSSDYSSATYPITYACVKGLELKVLGLDDKDEHPDKGYFEIINKMGANLKSDYGCRGQKVKLLGGTFNINHCIDTLPLFCLVGAFCIKPLKLTGAAICAKKESNRIEAMCCELTKMGVNIQANQDGCLIFPSKLKPADTKSHADHRVAMTLFLANKLFDFKCTIDNLECISKSYPSFLQDMSML